LKIRGITFRACGLRSNSCGSQNPPQVCKPSSAGVQTVLRRCANRPPQVCNRRGGATPGGLRSPWLSGPSWPSLLAGHRLGRGQDGGVVLDPGGRLPLALVRIEEGAVDGGQGLAGLEGDVGVGALAGELE